MTTFNTYAIGFIFSILLTAAAFVAVAGKLFPTPYLVGVLVGLAAIQLGVQLVCFLHVGARKRQGWNTIALLLAAFVVMVVVGGTIWIMNHLNHNMTMPNMEEEENIFMQAHE